MAFNKYGRYHQRMMYDRTARGSLRIDLYDMKNTIEDEIFFMESSMYRFRGLPLYEGYSDDQYKLKFFLSAAAMCYIPYDTVGYAYIQEKLGEKSLVAYRYENVMRKLSYMGILLDDADQKALYNLFATQETNVFRLDAAGIAALALRVRTAIEGESYSARGCVASLLLSKAFKAKIDEIAQVASLGDLTEMDISEYLPKYTYTLYGKDADYLDFLFEEQSFPALYRYEVSMDEYVKVANKQITSVLLHAKDKDAKVGDKITIGYDNLQISAEITRIRHYADYTELPHEAYGFGIGTKNPYFYDNESTREHGGLTLADFAMDERHETSETFTVLYHAHQLADYPDAKELYLIKKERDVYMHVSYSSPFLLKECRGGRTVRAVSPKPPELIGSKQELLSKMEDGIPSIPTRLEIENGCFSAEDYKNYLHFIHLKIEE